MSKTLTDRTIALAGLFQAVMLVDHVARRGVADSELLETAIRSLFVTNPETTEGVFGNRHKIRDGLMLIANQMGGTPDKQAMEQTRYAITLVNLERKLSKRQDLLEKISEGLEDAEKQAALFHMTHENVIANLADIYLTTISTLSPRIMVSGEHGHLQNPANANKVRALLLAGMRAAVLWRQCGGNRLQLLLQRKALVNEANALLME